MDKLVCNIDYNDRVNRVVIGLLLIVGGLIGLGKIFLLLVGTVLVVQGAIGWCGIPYLMAKFKSPPKAK